MALVVLMAARSSLIRAQQRIGASGDCMALADPKTLCKIPKDRLELDHHW